jgi:hypothetical protein
MVRCVVQKKVIRYAFIFVISSCLLFLPLFISAQNTKGSLSFGNCKIEFLYPAEWKNFITDYSKCEDSDPNLSEDILTDIALPKPGLSEKITPRVTISIEPCCELIPASDIEGYPAQIRKMNLDEYVNQTLNNLNNSLSVINVGHISLAGNEAYKIVVGLDSMKPTAQFVYSINGTKLYTINYSAGPSEYDTYLPGVQKIVESFKIHVS